MSTITQKVRTRKQEAGRRWYLKNRERRLVQCRAYYQSHREQTAVTVKAYREKHPEMARQIWRKHQRIHAEKCRTANRSWRARNVEMERARTRAKGAKEYAGHREKILAKNRAWAAANKDKIRMRDLRRKALILGAKINLANMQEWMASIKAKRLVTCYYCNKKVLTKAIHFDHIVALKNGGPHSVENLCVSCIRCNCSKQAKRISAWVRIGQQVLEL